MKTRAGKATFSKERKGKDFATHERMPDEKLQVQSPRLIFNAAGGG